MSETLPALMPTAGTELSAEVIGERLSDYAEAARGAFTKNTERAIQSDTAIFAAWCAERGYTALPCQPKVLAEFIDAMAETRKPASIARYVASIGHQHRAAGLADPSKA